MFDELLLRPGRLTDAGRRKYASGDHPQALSDFERAARARPQDARSRYNVADGLYKNGKFDEAATLFRSLGEHPSSPLAAPSRFNLGNALYQKQDYRGAIQAYREALGLSPDDLDTRRNLELALRALQEQEEDKKKQQEDKNKQGDQGKQDKPEQNKDGQQNKPDPQKPGDGSKQQQGQSGQQKTPEQRENERFQEKTGMPKDRAMQLLDALQQNEKAEQKKLLLAKRAQRKSGKDW